ncbi:MAG: DUF5682 family protein [Oscillospiraceae bacterium]|jgi:hypothetical protein|nr:DUF5682 family protein [Oscillospiraceae bacterium]
MDKIAPDISRLLARVFKPDENIVFFPVRHHSPACAWHIRKAARLCAPDCILIEGPADTDRLIPSIIGAEPPSAVYYSYKDEEGRYACYYPMLEYSPELVALKEASAMGVPAHFIDLPFGNIVREERKFAKAAGKTGRKSYYDDYFLQRSRYIERLCERENCRDYSELWEKLFEIPAGNISTEDFIKNMFTLCYYSRVDYPEELSREELNPQREMFMAEKILEYGRRYKKILVVSGGFHTSGLIELLESGKIQKQNPVSGEAYIIPYSFGECDQLSGYQSGMPYPMYYQSVYEALVKNKAESQPFRETTLVYITKLAKALRKAKENISLSEEAAAFSLCVGLAAIRDKEQCGVYELLDGVRSAFVKGELNLSSSFVLKETAKLLRGEKIGKVGADAPVPPIVLDFEAQAKLYRLSLDGSRKKDLSLEPVSKPRHREASVLLHRLVFLENPFAQKTAGPDYENRRRTKLLREKWDYAFSGRVSAALIEKSHLGGSIKEACESRLSGLIKDECHSSADAAELLVKAGVMALFSQTAQLMDLAESSISEDNSFVSLAKAIEGLSFLKGIEHILRIDELNRLPGLINRAFSRAVTMISALTASDEKEDFELAKVLKILHQVSVSQEDGALFPEALEDLLARKNCPPLLDGAASGLLYKSGELSLEGTLARANAYFTSTGETLTFSGRFLRGLFMTARDLVFYDDGFLKGLESLLENFSYEDFLTLLPDLRLSFTNFSPGEINRIAEKVLEILGAGGKQQEKPDLLSLPAADEKTLHEAALLDGIAYSWLEKRGYLA